MKEPTLMYHNPRCSKSCAALKILRANEIEPQIIEYLKTPPDAKTLRDLLKKLHLRPRDIIREGEEEYATLKLSGQSTDGELIAAIVLHPILLQRPIVVHGERAVVGRPPEKVNELLSNTRTIRATANGTLTPLRLPH